MAFKKNKKDKKKKTKRTKKDEEWQYEGGVTIEGDESNLKKKRIVTQEKDEKFRRSRRKLEQKRLTNEFVKKMATKVNFLDILKGEDNNDSEENIQDDNIIDEVDENIPQEQFKSKLSVLDRLKWFVDKNAHQENNLEVAVVGDEKVDDEKENELLIDDQSEENENDNEINRSSYLLFQRDSMGNVVADREIVDESNALSDSDDEELFSKKKKSKRDFDFYDWFFNRSDSLSTGLKKVKPTLKGNLKLDDEEASLYTALNELLPKDLPLPLSINDIPGIYKLWKNYSQSLNPFHQQLISHLTTYADCYIEGRNHLNDEQMVEVLLMHSLFNVVKSRAKVVRHNEKLRKKKRSQAFLQSSGNDSNGEEEEKIDVQSKKKQNNKRKSKVEPVPENDVDIENDERLRDQGYCRPRLLILCPFRNTLKSIVNMIANILGPNTSISNLEKFQEEYADPDESEDEEDIYDHINSKNKHNKGKTDKPEDWKATFKGNIDDDFKMGIQLNPGHGKGSGSDKGVYLRLYSDFYISDIIIASPIGLKLAIENNGSKSLDFDFLSSIEQVIIHQADVLYMQNWDHLDYILRHTNNLPKLSHDTDYSRVRNYFLDGKGANHRQIMLTTNFNTPELLNFFRTYGQSKSGYFRTKKIYNHGVISNVVVNVKQIFQIIPSIRSLDMLEDQRFQYFKENVLLPLLNNNQSRTLIVTPSYLHFIRVRNELMNQDASAVYISEYSRDSEISRGRARFFQGQKNIMLYSGRAHFYRRFKIRGVRHIIFYSLPEYPHFYSEFVNMLTNSISDVDEQEKSNLLQNELSCITLFSQYEKMPLERIVGLKRADHMLTSDKSTFLFY